jgi:hypothetical protein
MSPLRAFVVTVLLTIPIPAVAATPERIVCLAGTGGFGTTVNASANVTVVDRYNEPVYWYFGDVWVTSDHGLTIQASGAVLGYLSKRQRTTIDSFLQHQNAALGQIYVSAVDGTDERLGLPPCHDEDWYPLEDPNPPPPNEDNSPPGDGTDNDDDGTPLLIDFDHGGFKLTGLEGGVRFDLDRDGAAEQLSWTEAGGGDGWLALDRNGNGTIDDGGELFGGTTDQPATDDPQGFAALAVFDRDADGGDGDGWITPIDEVYSDLRVWVDANRNGTSEPAELSPLQDAGVTAIHLLHVESRRSDRHGNHFRFQGSAQTARGRARVVDVYLLTEP